MGNPTHVKFSQMAWFKFLAMRNAGVNEVAGFGVTRTNDPLFIDDFVLVKHDATPVTFEFDDEAMGDFQGKMFAEGVYPDQCRRIVCHTHPGNDATPSHTDWTNFKEHYENQDWCLMIILAHGGSVTATLRVKTCPDAHEGSQQAILYIDKALDVKVEGRASFDHMGMADLAKLPWAQWQKEYDECNITKKVTPPAWGDNNSNGFSISGVAWVPGTKSPNAYVFPVEAWKAVELHLKSMPGGNQIWTKHFLEAKDSKLIKYPYANEKEWFGLFTQDGTDRLKAWTREIRGLLLAEKVFAAREMADSVLNDTAVPIDVVDRLLNPPSYDSKPSILWDCWNSHMNEIKSDEGFKDRYLLSQADFDEIKYLDNTDLGLVQEALEQYRSIGVFGVRRQFEYDEYPARYNLVAWTNEARKKAKLKEIDFTVKDEPAKATNLLPPLVDEDGGILGVTP